MATKTTTTVICDVCGQEKEWAESGWSAEGAAIMVVFTTEQTEGRSVSPYLSNAKIDLCGSCLRTMLDGKMIFASGAMGYNTYWFKKGTV